MITLGAFNLLAAVLFTTFPGEAATPCKLHLHQLTRQGERMVWVRLLTHSSCLHAKHVWQVSLQLCIFQ